MQPKLPKAIVLADDIELAAKRILSRHQNENYAKYILVISDFDLYIPANMSEVLKDLLETKL